MPVESDSASQAMPRGSDHDAFEFDGAGVLAQPAQDNRGLEATGICFGKGSAVALLTPLVDEGLRDPSPGRRCVRGRSRLRVVRASFSE